MPKLDVSKGIPQYTVIFYYVPILKSDKKTCETKLSGPYSKPHKRIKTTAEALIKC